MKRRVLLYTIIITALAAAIVYIVGFKAINTGGSWVCVNGQWVKFGNPSAPMPQIPCSGATANQTRSINVNFRTLGTIANEDNPDVGWKFVYGGSTAYLLFTDASLCDFGKGGGPCPRSKTVANIVGNTVSVEGEKSGDKVIVAKLTLTK